VAPGTSEERGGESHGETGGPGEPDRAGRGSGDAPGRDGTPRRGGQGRSGGKPRAGGQSRSGAPRSEGGQPRSGGQRSGKGQPRGQGEGSGRPQRSGAGPQPRGGQRTGRGDQGGGVRRPQPPAGAPAASARHPGPLIPDDVTGAELDRDVRSALSSLSAFSAREVARRLVMVGRLIDDDPEAAWDHALAGRAHAARIGLVREAAGLAAYRAGHYAEALAELRTARRLTGSDEHLPVIADSERALGRPERALAIAASPEVARLDAEHRVEMLIVEAGARADLGELDAAVVTLQVGLLDTGSTTPWVARLRLAYADALAAVGREREAQHWLERAADADPDDLTGVHERLAESEGVSLTDLEEDEGAEPDDAEPEDAEMQR
jgi:hypothetical protein